MLENLTRITGFFEKIGTGIDSFFMSLVARSWGRVPSKSKGINGVIITENKKLDFSRTGDLNPIKDLEPKQ